MVSPRETAALRHVLEMGQANQSRLARVLGISVEYSETILRGLNRKGLLALGHGPRGSKHAVYKLTPSGAEELLRVLGLLRHKESERANRAELNMGRVDRRIADCQALMARRGLIVQETTEGVP